MSGSLNKVQIIGHLGQDPEARKTTGGPMTIFSVATNSYRANSNGDDENGSRNRRGEFGRNSKRSKRQDSDNQPENDSESVEWHRIVTFGKLAERCRDYLAKGRQVYVEGSIKTSNWEDDEGHPHISRDIVAWKVLFLGKAERAA